MVQQWELEKAREWDTNTIKNRIWAEVDCGQPVPGCVSVDALRCVLLERGEEPVGYHNT